VLWAGHGETELTARCDCERLDQAVAFVLHELPLGIKHTAWTISGGLLIAPEQIAELAGKIAA